MSVPRGCGGGERFRWYSDGRMFVEMDRGGGGGFCHIGKDNQCAYCQYLNLPAHLYRLISLFFSPF